MNEEILEPTMEDGRVTRWVQTFFATAMVVWLLLGVWLWKWDVRVLVLLYWLENIIIGGFQVGKMILLPRGEASWRGLFIARGCCVGFFLFHFGIFCAVHGVFLLMFASMNGAGSADAVFDTGDWWGPFMLLGLFENVVSMAIAQLPSAAMWSLAAMAVSQFVQLLAGRKVWREKAITELMVEPYKHIVVVHVAILFGAALVLWAGNSIPLLMIMVIGKYLIDLREIWRERKSVKTTESLVS